MRLNLGNFLIKKPLRWAFSQAFGSKTKTWFDGNVGPAIDLALSTGIFSYEIAIAKFLDNEFVDNLLKQVTTNVGIPKNYEGVAKDFLKSEIEKILKEKFSKDSN